MMRDHRKSQEYFREYKEKETKRIENFEINLAANKVVAENIETVKQLVSGIKFEILIAEYSDGTDLKELREAFVSFIQSISKNWFYEGYSETMWVLSWGILLDIDNDDMRSFLLEVETQYKDDWLMSFLLSYKVESFLNTAAKVKFKKPYQAIKDIIENGNNKEEKLAKYLQTKWYKENSDTGWYDIHKSKENSYYGYWSFETAAIVKILGLDAQKLSGVEYFPGDLHLPKNNKE